MEADINSRTAALTDCTVQFAGMLPTPAVEATCCGCTMLDRPIGVKLRERPVIEGHVDKFAIRHLGVDVLV
jgi:hypothetical protein